MIHSRESGCIAWGVVVVRAVGLYRTMSKRNTSQRRIDIFFSSAKKSKTAHGSKSATGTAEVGHDVPVAPLLRLA